MSLESSVKYYSNSFPVIFSRAKGSYLYSERDEKYTDFLSCCGALNYGHNDDCIKSRLIDYLESDGITSSLDMATSSRQSFLHALNSIILQPRGLDYRVQFTNPTGTNAVEAAIKLARKVTGRTGVVAFTNAFHGCSLGALAATGNTHHRASSEVLLNQTTRMPYDGYFGDGINSADMLRAMLADPSSGVAVPAAILFEPVQGEGGLNVAGREWAQDLQKIARDFDILLIADEIQTGCGRTGSFFAFEQLNIAPDMVLLAKSLSGYGLPLAVNLIKPDLDVWLPAEHNGTFRGNNLAFVSAATTLEKFWRDGSFQKSVERKSKLLEQRLHEIAASHQITACGIGLMRGLRFSCAELAENVRQNCFENKLILETCGPKGEVLKLMPPLTIEKSHLLSALNIVERSVQFVLGSNQLDKIPA